MYPLHASTYQFSLFSLRRKKKKKEINQRIYASNAVEKKWKAIYYFSFSIVRSRVTTKFSASKRASDETGLRSYVEITLSPSSCLFTTIRRKMIGRFSRISRYVFARLFATKNRVFIYRGPGMNHQQIS